MNLSSYCDKANLTVTRPETSKGQPRSTLLPPPQPDTTTNGAGASLLSAPLPPHPPALPQDARSAPHRWCPHHGRLCASGRRRRHRWGCGRCLPDQFVHNEGDLAVAWAEASVLKEPYASESISPSFDDVTRDRNRTLVSLIVSAVASSLLCYALTYYPCSSIRSSLSPRSRSGGSGGSGSPSRPSLLRCAPSFFYFVLRPDDICIVSILVQITLRTECEAAVAAQAFSVILLFSSFSHDCAILLGV